MITLILIITMIVDWLVIIWRWTWVVIMIMPIDSRCSLLIDYDEKHDWWFSDDNWSWLMNDDKGHRWWFIVIDNEVMDDKWLTDLLIDDKIMIMITKSVIIPAVSGLYRPTGLLYFWQSYCKFHKEDLSFFAGSDIFMAWYKSAVSYRYVTYICACSHSNVY